jgi:DNA uptake protein ComE-like DNA-binding protein
MDFKEQIKVFLAFSKKERRGIYVLSVIAMLLWILPVFFTEEIPPEQILEITPLQLSEARKLLSIKRDSFAYQKKYRSFYPKDVKQNQQQFPREFSFHEQKSAAPKQQRIHAPINLNEADSAALEALPGIGERLSVRIIKYRDRLGGFYDVVQLKEVYGLQDSVFTVLASRVFVRVDESIKKLAVNKCSYAEFRRHPYVGHVFAKSLVAFRQTHGEIQSLEELYQLVAVKKEEIDRMKPYFSFDGEDDPSP